MGYYDIYGFNTGKHELLVRGHWHGAGGSGKNEWTVYKMGSSWMTETYYLDIMNGQASVYDMRNGSRVCSSKAYRSIYNEHIKNGKKFPVQQDTRFIEAQRKTVDTER